MNTTTVICAIVFSVINYLIAENNGRNKGLAALWGFLFGIFAVIVYLIMGKKKDNVTSENKTEDKKSTTKSPDDVEI